MQSKSGNFQEKKKISFIVSIFNGEKYLKECLESIANQDYPLIEIIIVDDGSTDKSSTIIKDFCKKESRAKAIYKENSGVSDSRNQALSICSGDYVCIVDQDDVLSPIYASYLLNLINQYHAEIALTPIVDKFFHSKNKKNRKKDYVSVICGDEAAMEMLYHKYVIAPWNKMIRKKLIDDYKIKFNTNFFNGEGFAFSIHCLQHAKRVAVGHSKIYHYRVGDPDSGASVFKEKHIHSSINAQLFIWDTLINKTSFMRKAWEFSNWHTHCDALNVMIGCGAIDTHRELYDKIKRVCQEKALQSFTAPVSIQQKLRCLLFAFHPFLASKIINFFRVRQFRKI